MTLLIGCSKGKLFEDFFYSKIKEMNKWEKDYSYSLLHKELNVVHEDDAIAIFIENKRQEETIFIAYLKKEKGGWNWRQTTGTRWDSPIRWHSMTRFPYIHFGTINDNQISEVYAGGIQAAIIEVEEGKRLWYAICNVKDEQVIAVKKDGTQEVIEQTEGEGWAKKSY